MHALDQTWHVACFVCTACNQAFSDGVFQMENDKPYCVAGKLEQQKKIFFSQYSRYFASACSGGGVHLCDLNLGNTDPKNIATVASRWQHCI